MVYDHLIAIGFLKGYNIWVNHGEKIQSLPIVSDEDKEDNIDGLLHDTFRNVVEGSGGSDGPNEDAKNFYSLINEAKQELYHGCQSFSTLSFVIQLYLLKCLNGWSNASFSNLLKLLKEVMPILNILEYFNKAKAMIKDFGLDYKKIHACPHDCMLYWKEHEIDNFCEKCKTSRWKEFSEVNGKLEQQKNK